MANDRIISADSHVNPPKDLWTRNAPATLKDRVPRVESTSQGDFWIVDSQVSGAIGLDASAGRKPEEFKAMGLTYKDMRPGSYDPKARLEDMDLDAVIARRPEVALVDELAHTNAPGFRHRKRWEDVEAIRDAGLPDGVFNIVCGPGATAPGHPCRTTSSSSRASTLPATSRSPWPPCANSSQPSASPTCGRCSIAATSS